MHNKYESLLILLTLVLFSFLLFKWEWPARSVSTDSPETGFSAERALEHLQEFAVLPHAGGTDEHKRVRDYLVHELKEMGLEVEIRKGTSVRRGSSYAICGYAVNILARLKGSTGKKTVLVMAHYDSQPNTPGAADDGSGVASMLESIRAIRSSKDSFRNDILFLITDLEEVGLMGAERFVYDSLELDRIGLILNFEARGNSGTPMVFEVSEHNGWLMREFNKAAPHRVANSLGYEIYKLMPNDTDVTMFKSTGITYLNSAFIGGYVNYHSMTDTPERISLNSLQHQGSNMLALIRHFGNLELEKTRDEDYVFFNPVGHFLVLYPVKADLYLIILALGLFLACLIVGLAKSIIKIWHLLLGLGLVLASLLVSTGIGFGLQWVLLKAYPHYNAFYSSNFYNATLYFPALIGGSLISVALCFGWALKRFSVPSMVLGALLPHLVLLVLFKIYLSSGAYLLHLPLSISLIIFLVWMLYKPDMNLFSGRINFLMILFPLALWLPLAYLILVVFSMKMLAAPMIIFGLLTPFLLSLILISNRLHRRAFLIFSILLLLAGLAIAHFNSGISKEQPLQSNLNYFQDVDKGSTHWFSRRGKDDWTENYLQEFGQDNFMPAFWEKGEVWQGDAPEFKLDTGMVSVTKDTVMMDKRYLTLRILPGKNTVSFDLRFPSDALIYRLDDREINLSKAIGRVPFIRYHAPPRDGIEMDIRIDNDELRIELMERKLGIDKDLLNIPLPDDHIHRPGHFSNTMQVKRTICL